MEKTSELLRQRAVRELTPAQEFVAGTRTAATWSAVLLESVMMGLDKRHYPPMVVPLGEYPIASREKQKLAKGAATEPRTETAASVAEFLEIETSDCVDDDPPPESESFGKTFARGGRGVNERKARALPSDIEVLHKELTKMHAEEVARGSRRIDTLGTKHFRRGAHNVVDANVLHESDAIQETSSEPRDPKANFTTEGLLNGARLSKTHTIDEYVELRARIAAGEADAADLPSGDPGRVFDPSGKVIEPPTAASSTALPPSSTPANRSRRFLAGTNVGFLNNLSTETDVGVNARGELYVRGGTNETSVTIEDEQPSVPLSRRTVFERTYATNDEVLTELAEQIEKERARCEEPLSTTPVQNYINTLTAKFSCDPNSYLVRLFARNVYESVPQFSGFQDNTPFQHMIPVSRRVEDLYMREANLNNMERNCVNDVRCQGLLLKVDRPFILREADYLPRAAHRRLVKLDEAAYKTLDDAHSAVGYTFLPQQCVLCMRNQINNWYYEALATGVPAPADILIQNYCNLVDQEGEYRKEHCIHPPEDRYVGLVQPVVRHNLMAYRKVVRHEEGCRPLQMLEFIGAPPTVDPSVGFPTGPG